MACPIVVRSHGGVQSHLVLDDNPRELLRHVGFSEPLSVRPWLGSTDPEDALTKWAEMLEEDPDNYFVTDSDNRDYCSNHLPGTPSKCRPSGPRARVIHFKLRLPCR